MIITLTGAKGGTALVSKSDYVKISKIKWCNNANGYAQSIIEGISVLMHRYIMNIFDNNIIIDHINRNKLDNRRSNLRSDIGYKSNAKNQSIHKNKKTSKYRGVFYDKKNKKWQVTTHIGGVRKDMGCYKDEIAAAEVFDMYITHNKIEYVELNFPDKKNEYLSRKYVPYTKKKMYQYIGVKKNHSKFLARITHNGIDKCIIRSNDQLECAKAYDKYIVDNNISSKILNFPEDWPEYNPNCKIKSKYEETNDKNIIRLLINNKPDAIVLIDKEDYDKIKYYNWYIISGYVKTKFNNKTLSLSHVMLHENRYNIVIDHINGDPLNNCKTNLRVSDSQKNSHNRSKTKKKICSSKYTGVIFLKRRNTWSAYIKFEFKQYRIASFHKELDAARARDLYILLHYPDEHYKLNFEWEKKDIVKWQKKLTTTLNSDKWVIKTDIEKKLLMIERINKELTSNRLIITEKLHNLNHEKTKNTMIQQLLFLKF